MDVLGKWCGYGPTCGSGDSAFVHAHVTGCCVIPGLGDKIMSVGRSGDESFLHHTYFVLPAQADCGVPSRLPNNFGRGLTCLVGGVCEHHWWRR